MRLAVILLFSCLFSSCLALPPSNDSLRERFSSARRSVSLSDKPLKIWIPYAGQGDATLVQLPNQKLLLIDAGGPSAGRELVLPLLRSLGLSHLDALIITHYDTDHLGGVPGLLAGEDGQMGTDDDIHVDVAYDHGGDPLDNSPGLIPYVQALHDQQIPRHVLAAGERLSLDPKVGVECLAAAGKVDDGVHVPVALDLTLAAYSGKENAASIALLFEYGAFKYLTAGDLTGGGIVNGFATPDVETPLADAAGKVDVLHVNHHGSLSSSNARYVEATSPKAVFIQAGKDNPYGHPNPEVVKRWEAEGTQIYSTAKGDGFVLETQGGDFTIQALTF